MDRSIIAEAMSANNFTKNEIAVYLTLLETDQQNGISLAEKLNMDKTSVYRALYSLAAKGILAHTGTTYDKKFFIASPHSLEDYVLSKQNEKQKHIQTIKEFTSAIQATSNKEQVKVYKDENAVLEVFRQRIEGSPSLIREMHNLDAWNNVSLLGSALWEKLIHERVERGIPVKLLLDFPSGIDVTNAKDLKEVRIAPQGIELPAGMTIFGTKLALYNPESMYVFATIIDDEAISTMAASLFDFVWNASEEV